MARKPYQLSIVTPERPVHEGAVQSVVLPAVDGYVGIWANHAPMVVAMRPGILRVESADDSSGSQLQHFAVSSGFAEVSDNKLVILADTAEMQSEIDMNRAKAALDRARERLKEAMHDPTIDMERAQEAKDRAEARMRAAYMKEEIEVR